MRPLDPKLWLPVAGVCVAAPAFATQYLTAEQAQHEIFPDASEFAPMRVELTAEQRERIETRLGMRVRQARPAVWIARRGAEVLGHFIVDEVYGKHEFITYAVGIDKAGAVRGVEILDYRETRGGQVRDPRWRAQFPGKTARDPLRLDEDIRNISGATLSCRHITEGVRRLLATHDVALR